MTTVFSSFSLALDDISKNKLGQQREGKRTEVRTHVSGHNTAMCDPPASAIEIPVGHWIEKANTLCLGKPEVQAKLKEAYMPLMEQAHKVNSEEDIVVASAQHFTYPVNVALNRVHPHDSVLCEVSKNKDNSGPTSHLSRIDRMYFHGPPKEPDHPGSSANTMAGLEFKSFKALNAANFEEIIVRDRGAFAGRIAAWTDRDDPHSTETRNVSTILSQATHYVVKFGTPFVALFDYNTLILLVMKNTEIVQPKTKTNKAKARAYGDFAYMTVVKNSNQMRSAMLGFLLSAHLERENDDSWHKSANGTDILIDPSNLPSMGPSRTPGSRTLPDRTGTKRSYKERNTSESEGGSQSSPNRGHAAGHAAHAGPAAPGGPPRKPSGLVKTSSSLSSPSTSSSSSVSSRASSGSATTVSSAGSAGKPTKPNPNAHVTTTTSAAKTATASARPPSGTTTATSSRPNGTNPVKQPSNAAPSPAASAAKKTVRG